MTTKRLTIELMQKIAKERSGKCLSKKYINDRIPLKWKCQMGHVWKTAPEYIRRGHWCKKCSTIKNAKNKIRYTIQEMKQIAFNREGLCLSDKYINGNTPLKWICKNKHIWKKKPSRILEGFWCPKCGIVDGGKKRRLSIDLMYRLAKEKNGKCLSKRYILSNTPLKWRCNKDGYEWWARPADILHGTWCPHCSSFRSERICREYLENKTGYKFIKCKPSWLKGLELDGYCKKLNLAFEYNGEQHYKQIKRFHNKKDFFDQQKRDILKKKLCKQNNIKLIKIPYTYNCYDPSKLYKFIDNKLKVD
jgi:hypothetical protein